MRAVWRPTFIDKIFMRICMKRKEKGCNGEYDYSPFIKIGVLEKLH